MDRPQPSQRGARASQAHVVRLLPRDSQRSGAPPRVCHAKACCAGGRTWHIAPRPLTEWEKPPAGAVAVHSTWSDHNHRGAARVCRKHACCASSQVIASAVARPRTFATRKPAVREAALVTSHHGLAPSGRGLLLVQWSLTMRELITTSAARHARVAGARAAPPPERQPAQRRARAFYVTRKPAVCWMEAAADTSQHSLAQNGRGLSLVQWPSVAHRPTTTIAARRARVASARAAPPPKRQPAQRRACAFVTRKPT